MKSMTLGSDQAPLNCGLDALMARGLYAHSIPGRLRIEAPAIRENVGLANRAAGRLRELPGVTFVEPRTVTGRVLVEYQSGKVHPDAIVAVMAATGCFEGFEGEPRVAIVFQTLHDVSGSGRRPAPWSAGAGRMVLTVLAETAARAAIEGLLLAAL